MWDAKFGNILHTRKDPMPDDCMIDDNHIEGDDKLFAGSGNNNNSFCTPCSTMSLSSRLQATSSGRGIESVVNEIQEEGQVCNQHRVRCLK
jgi:hypothetical protein